MPSGVVYAPKATDHLEELYRYIAERGSPAIAERYTSAEIETCEGLAMFPLRGVSREDIRPELRVTDHRGHTVIAYAVDHASRTVSVLEVLYGGQDFERTLAQGGDP